MPEPLILPIRGRGPQLHSESWVAPIRQVSAPLFYQFLTSTRPLTAKDAERAVDAAIVAITAGVFVRERRRTHDSHWTGSGTSVR